jgi:hypothetical protein
MSEDDSVEDVEDILEKESLPRIVVEEEDILVFEDNFWVEKNVVVEKDSEEEGEEDLAEDEESSNVVLENIVGGLNENVLDESVLPLVENDFYQQGGGKGDLYDAKMYSDVKFSSDYIDVDFKSSEDIEEGRRGGRSMLEIAGFEDFESEKKRKEKREGSFK